MRSIITFMRKIMIKKNICGNGKFPGALLALPLLVVSLACPAQTIISSLPTHAINQSWNLVGNDSNVPIDAVLAFGSSSAPISGVSTNINSVWQWNYSQSKWGFFAPSMDSTTLSAYASQKGYLVLSQIAKGEGFWLNAVAPFSITFAYNSTTQTPPTLTVEATCAESNFTTAALNAIQSGMTLAQVNQTIGCAYDPSSTVRMKTNVVYSWTQPTSIQRITVWFDATGATVTSVGNLAGAEFKSSSGF